MYNHTCTATNASVNTIIKLIKTTAHKTTVHQPLFLLSIDLCSEHVEIIQDLIWFDIRSAICMGTGDSPLLKIFCVLGQFNSYRGSTDLTVNWH